MKNTVFKGTGVAIVTPMNEDFSVNFDKLGELIDFQINNGTDALIICGTTGESSTLTDDEHKEAIRFAVEKTAKRIPVIAGTGSNDIAYSLELSEYSKDVGADALLLVSPYYNKTTQAGLVKSFTYIADRVDLPVILYNVPSRTGIDIKPETYYELSKHPRIVATKEANGDIHSVAKTIYLCGENLDVYSGNDDQIVPIMSLGGIGIISVLSNILPAKTSEIARTYLKGDTQKSAKLQVELMGLIDAIFIEVNPIPVKTALNLMGKNAGPLRLPLVDMSQMNLEILKQELIAHNLI